MRPHRARLFLASLLLVALLPGVGNAVPDELTVQLDEAESTLADLDARVSMAVEEYNAAAAQLERIQDQHRQTAEVVTTLTAEVEELEDRTAAFVRSMYIHGPANDLTHALHTDEVTEAGRDLAVIDRLSRQRQAELEQLSARRIELDAARSQMAAQVAAAEEREQDLADHRAAVEAMVADQQTEVVALQDEISRIQAEEAAAEQRRREAAEAEVARRAAAASEAAAAAATEAAASEAAASAAAAEAAAQAATTADAPSPDASQPPAADPPPPPEPAPTGTRSGADTAVQAALSQVGKPYEYAAEGPDSYDCSGLTLWAWRHAGVSLPHSSRMQYSTTTRIDRGDLQPGDLIFFGSPIHHVAMYIGDGKVVEAPYTGTNVRVNERSLSRSDIAGYGRV